MTWLIPLALIAAFAIWFVRTSNFITQPTKGPHIGPDRTNRALLLIDLQTVFWTDAQYPTSTREGVETQVAKLVAKAKENGQPVIAIRHEWSTPSAKFVARVALKGMAIAGSKGTEIAAPFQGLADHTITKRVTDAFETETLPALLKSLNVRALDIAGLDGNSCVQSTARAAAQRGYDVTLHLPAVASAKPDQFIKTQTTLKSAGITLQADPA